MSVNLIPILIDERILADEIVRLSKVLPPEKLDDSETIFIDALFYEESSEQNQYVFAGCRNHRNHKWCFDADAMRFQMLTKARETVIDAGRTEQSADGIFQFFGAIFGCYNGNNPLNEYGFQNSTIISTPNSRRLHLLFQHINFDLLRPVFEQHCKTYDDGHKYGYISSFRELVDYATALDGLLIQAIQNNKMLYIFISR
jgi:hypothetical protein